MTFLSKKFQTLILFLAITNLNNALQKRFDPKAEDPEGWVKDMKGTFDPEKFQDIDLIKDIPSFESGLKVIEEAFVFFFTKEDPMTFALYPFFQTSTKILKNNASKVRSFAVDVSENPEIAVHYGLSHESSNIAFFYNGAPILFKHNTMSQEKKGMDVWMAESKQLADNVPRIKTHEDLEIFQNSDKLILLVQNEEDKERINWFRSIAVNFKDIQFAFMVRDDMTKKFEEKMNSKFNLEHIEESKKITHLKKFLSLLILYRYNLTIKKFAKK